MAKKPSKDDFTFFIIAGLFLLYGIYGLIVYLWPVIIISAIVFLIVKIRHKSANNIKPPVNAIDTYTCPSCGEENVNDSVYCISCGTKIKSSVSLSPKHSVSHNVSSTNQISNVKKPEIKKKSAEVLSSPKPIKRTTIFAPSKSTINDISNYDLALFTTVMKILEQSGIPTEPFELDLNPPYLNIYVTMYSEYPERRHIFMRFKTRGRLQYWLPYCNYNDFLKKYPSSFKVTETSTSESHHRCRVFIEQPNDLYYFSNYILSEYERIKNDEDHYIEWIKKGKPRVFGRKFEFYLNENNEVDFNAYDLSLPENRK